MPTLTDIVNGLASADIDGTIYAAEPWTPSSQAIIGREPDEGGIPGAAETAGLSYFLEVSIALEVLEAFAAKPGGEVALQARVERIIKYAVRDA